MKKILLLVVITGLITVGIVFTGRAASESSSSVNFNDTTVTGATNMSAKPQVTSESKLPAAKLKVKDLVVGTGPAADPSSTVTVQYVGIRYADGKQFDSSWDRGSPATFSLRKVVKGFTQGIGGTDDIPPMKVGGRRIIIVPSEMGYGEAGTPDGSIPPNATIVFVVDLRAVQ